MTPIDITRLRALAAAVSDAGALLSARRDEWHRIRASGRDAYDVSLAHRDASDALRAAQKALYADASPDEIILALLDEVERLRIAAGEVDHPFVCPGCHAVGEEPCLTDCIDAELDDERRVPFDGFSEFNADDEGDDEHEEGGAA